MVQIISTWLFQPNKHKFAKFLSSDRNGLSEGRIQVWIIQQSLISGLVLIECGDIIKKLFVGLARTAVRDDSIAWSEPRSSVASFTVCVSDEISEERGLCKSTRHQKGLHETQMCETAYTGQKPELLLSKSLLSPASASKTVSNRVTKRFAI